MIPRRSMLDLRGILWNYRFDSEKKEFNGIIEKTNSRKWVAEKSYDTKESER